MTTYIQPDDSLAITSTLSVISAHSSAAYELRNDSIALLKTMTINTIHDIMDSEDSTVNAENLDSALSILSDLVYSIVTTQKKESRRTGRQGSSAGRSRASQEKIIPHEQYPGEKV